MIEVVPHHVTTRDGWELSLFQTFDPEKLVAGRRPVAIVPGYGMNSFIFSWHPRGVSLEGHLVERGFEVWRVDLRGQGASRRTDGGDPDRYSLGDLALVDLPAALATVVAKTRTGTTRVDVLGASLGGTLLFAYLVLRPLNPVASVVGLGAPVRWVASHPLLRAAFVSSRIAGAVRLGDTRGLVTKLLPRLVRFAPWVLSIYMNPGVVDLSAASELVKTVENPSRHVNREIALWLRRRDLELEGVRIGESLAKVKNPILCVYGTGDGIVPPATARFVYDACGSNDRSLLEVGSKDVGYAHADLFVSNEAHERVFRPLGDWLVARG